MPQQKVSQINCPNCNTELRHDAVTCYHCGQSLRKMRGGRITGIPLIDAVLRILGVLALILALGITLICRGCVFFPG